MTENRRLNTRAKSRMNRTFNMSGMKIEENEEKTMKKSEDIEKKCEILGNRVLFLEEKLKSEGKWKESYIQELDESNKKLKQFQNYVHILEAKLKSLVKQHASLKSKLAITEDCLKEAKSYLVKAKTIIENNEIQIETYRSRKISLIQTLKSLFSDSKLNSLSLKYLELEDDFIEHLGKILRLNPTIEFLDLEGNKFTDKAAVELSEIIAYSPAKLSTVNLEFNFISPEGAWELLKGIRLREAKSKAVTNSRISQIKLSFNKFTSDNDLFAKVWDFLEENKVEARRYIDRKFLLSTTPSVVAKAFQQISENYENSDVKGVIAAVLRIQIEGIKPLTEKHSNFEEQEEKILEHFAKTFKKTEKNDGESSEEGSEEEDESQGERKRLNIAEEFREGFKNYSRVVDKIMDEGVDVDDFDESIGETMLMFAARNNRLDFVQYLIRKGADTELINVIARQKDGENAFFIAAKAGNFEIAEFLQSKGSKPNSCDKE
jgi:hypothetical protein